MDLNNNEIKLNIEKRRLEAEKKKKNKEKITLARHLRIPQKQQGNIREDLISDRDASGNLNNNRAWKSLRDLEEDGCVRRFLCELAAGHIVTSLNDNSYKILVKQLIHFVDNKTEENVEDKVMLFVCTLDRNLLGIIQIF